MQISGAKNTQCIQSKRKQSVSFGFPFCVHLLCGFNANYGIYCIVFRSELIKIIDTCVILICFIQFIEYNEFA